MSSEDSSLHRVRPSRPSFEFADGLRGVAAIAVALFHTLTYTGRSDENDALPAIFRVLNIGDFAVAVFIVLSGFVLMLPVAASPELQLRGGVIRFLRRRARRILPPYYAAVGLFLLVILLVPGLNERTGTAWDSKVPVTLGGVLSHLFLVHNLVPAWAYQIDGPAWSVATEWQIYFAMPFVLLPAWRRLGGIWTVTLAILAGWAFHFAVPQADSAHLWFVGLFAMGMTAAWMVRNGKRLPVSGFVLISGMVLVFGVATVAHDTAVRGAWFTETVLGAAVAASLVWLGSKAADGERSAAHRVLESKPLIRMGLWSYSFYLVHSPIIGLANLALLPVPMPLVVRFALLACVALPVAAAASYGFHRLVERRFMTSHQQSVRAAERV